MRSYCRKHGIDSWALELKLATPDARYWLCTHGLSEACSGVPEGLVAGYVLPVHRQQDGTWERGCPYGPHEATFLQGIDYCRWLADQLRSLYQREVIEQSRDGAAEMAAVRAELRGVRKILWPPQQSPGSTLIGSQATAIANQEQQVTASQQKILAKQD
jgi:hypothetical protein